MECAGAAPDQFRVGLHGPDDRVAREAMRVFYTTNKVNIRHDEIVQRNPLIEPRIKVVG